jgi:hypothetical protein
VERLMDFIADSLELLPQPAALFACESTGLKYVASNAHASKLNGLIFNDGAGDPIEDRLQSLGLDKALATAALMEFGTYTARVHDYGILHATKLSPPDQATRPKLLLATLHEGVSDKTAWVDHNRIVMSIRINENGEIALRALENMLIQAQSAVSAQRDMLRAYNRRMGEFLSLNYDDTPGKSGS